MNTLNKKRKLIYVCSPYSGGSHGFSYNTSVAREACRKVFLKGYLPIAPHLYLPQFVDEKTERNSAIEINKQIIESCDAIFVFGDEMTDWMIEETRTVSIFTRANAVN